ncbi:MAG TPA: alkaline phosphatase family protein [Candidatus Limnocylindrales bacterium]
MKIRAESIRVRAAIILGAAAFVAACGGSVATKPSPSGYADTAGPPTSAIAVTGLASVTAAPTPSSTPHSGPPDFKHIYMIILENKEFGRIVGSSAAPYMNQLIARYGQATNLYAETHPSEPNYIALTSGGLQGTNSDGTYNLAATSLFDQVEASGRTWHVYAQGYPGACFRSFLADPVQDGPGAVGEYVRKHNPAISYTAVSANPTRCANITNLSGFDPAAADFEMIIPNQVNDMHSGSVRAGDDFLKEFVPQITGSPAFKDSLLIVTFDEGDSNDQGGGHIATILASAKMTPGSRFDGPATHYSLLRTIESAWGMPFLGLATMASTITLPY